MLESAKPTVAKSKDSGSTSQFEPHSYCGDRVLAEELSAHRLPSLGRFVVRPRAANDDDDPAVSAATCETPRLVLE